LIEGPGSATAGAGIGARPVVPPTSGVLILLLAALAVVWFANLEHRKLIRPDEGRYADLARYMATSGDWVTPRLNGLKYFYKPPLQYWATATAYNTFGLRHWTTRLWPALTGFLGILLIGYAGWRLYGPTVGLYSAAVLASSGLYVAIAHINTLDMGLTLFMTGTLCAVLLAQQPGASDRERRNWMLAAWASAALAVLSKGLIGIVLPSAALVLYMLIERDWRLLLRLHLPSGLLLFLAIAAPWFIAVSLRNPEFFDFFFIHEHFERFLTTVHRRTEPWWFFLEIQALGFLPWLPAMVAGLWTSWRVERGGDGFKPARLLAIYAVFIVVFFSLSSSKLASYTLPAWPALALLTGLALSRVSSRGLALQIAPIAVLALVGLGLSGALEGFADDPDEAMMFGEFAWWIAAGTLLMLLGSAAACWIAVRGRITAAVLTLAFALLAGWQVLISGHDRLSPSTSVYHLVRQIEPQLARDLRPDTPFYSVEVLEQTLNFYIRRETTMVAFRDELDFGLTQEPQRWIPTLAEFETVWRAQPVAFAIMRQHTFDHLTQRELPMVVLARNERRIIVRTPPPAAGIGTPAAAAPDATGTSPASRPDAPAAEAPR
jgi:4-amino-4-deoxy-L-arabinose transferase-like glycosyltransferase